MRRVVRAPERQRRSLVLGHGSAREALLRRDRVSAAYTYTDARDRMSMDADRGGDICQLDAGGRHAGASEAPHLDLGAAAQDHLGGHHRSSARLPARPHLRRHVRRSRIPMCRRAIPTRMGSSRTSACRTMWSTCRRTPATSLWPTRPSSPRSTASFRKEPCLRSQRGRLLERNSCRDPWVHETTAQLSKRFRLADRRTLEVTADLFNVLNFVDGDWGLVRQTFGDVGQRRPAAAARRLRHSQRAGRL